MHSREIRKILDDEETFDIAKAAEAVLEENRIRAKKLKPSTRENSLAAYEKHKARKQAKEAYRQALAKSWNKTHH